jgi:chorismate dehydratase
MLKLGHIGYSNCIPVHALLLEQGAPAGIEVESGIPSELNRALEAGRVDVAPSSSIEFARHADRYRLLPDFAIASDGAVESILLETSRPPEELDGAEVWLPTASATSVVLLRILLERRWGVRPRYRWFEQRDDVDPLAEGAAAALWIGDIALRRGDQAQAPCLDLGAEWKAWTTLPFVYAVWQISAGPEKDEALRSLHALLHESRRFFDANVDALAARYAPRHALEPARLARYWRALDFTLGERMQAGLVHYYRLAAELGEVPGVPTLRWLTP